jgi:Gnt-I system high-affinity gluconate transporter
MQAFVSRQLPENALPGALNSFFSALLPVLLLIVTSLLTSLMVVPRGLQGLLAFISEPSNVMILALLFATASLGLCNGKTMKEVMHIYGESIKDIAMILLVIGGSGAFKQVLVDSGVSQEIAAVLMVWKLHPLVLAWMIAAIIRVSIGSSTVAGLTTAGIIAPMGAQLHMEPSLMVLSIGAGSLMFSHVNDPGFWMFKEYFNLSLKETIRSWSMMETIVSVMGLAGVMIIYYFI